MAFRLGVDLGTTFTAAAVDDGTGPTVLGLGNRALTVPSVVHLVPDGTFLFGEAADRRAAVEPARSAREFKRRIGDTVPILLAGQPFSPQALSAKLLAWVVGVATERQGSPPDEVVVTYPANWGGYKRELLTQITTLADLPHALTCTEPEAAAAQYAARAAVAPGETLAVYDLGGGTFDVCVLEKQENGFQVLGTPDGVEHLGGIDFDEAVFQHTLALLGDRTSALDLDDPEITQGLARLRRDCVDAKESLSSDVEATIPVALPGLSTSLRMTRSELEGLISGPLRDTLDATRRALRSAGVEAADLTTVVLVGGSSRIPLVSHLLQSEFGARTAMDTHPKHDIALGAVRHHPLEEAAPTTPVAPPVTRWPTRGSTTTPSGPETPAVATPSPEADPATPSPTAVAVAEEGPTGPPLWTPPDREAPSTTGGPSRSRHPSRRILIGIGAAVVLLVAGVSSYAMTRGADSGDAGGSLTTSSDPSDEAVDPRVFPTNTLLVPVSDGPESRSRLVAYTSEGERVETVARGTQSYEAPWISPTGAFVGYRMFESVDSGDPAVIMVMDREREPTEFIQGTPPQGITCPLRATWDPTSDRVVLLCRPKSTDGWTNETELWGASATADGHVSGPALEPVLSNDMRTQDSPEGSPDSILKAPGFLADGRLAVEYDGGQEPGIHVLGVDGSIDRLTSGEADEHPSPSPDRPLIAFTRDGDLYLAPADDEPLPCPEPREPTTDEETGTQLCNLTAGVTSLPDAAALEPAWSWDGGQITFAMGSETGPSRLMVISLDGGEPKPVIDDRQYFGWIAWGPR